MNWPHRTGPGMTSPPADGPAPAVLLARQGKVALLTLNRPDKANAINNAVRHGLFAAADELAADKQVSVVVVTGAGRTFCAGADLREPRRERDASRQRYPSATDLGGQLPQPVIAAIDGPALGGGLELALKCDLRIVAADAQLGLPEIQFGALPTGGGMIRLPRLVGISAAKLMVLSGEPVSGIQAYRMGLADAVAEGPVLQAAMELATRMARRPRYALLSAKQVIDAAADTTVAEGNRIQAEVTARMASGRERLAQRRSAATANPVYRRIFGPPGHDQQTQADEHR